MQRLTYTIQAGRPEDAGAGHGAWQKAAHSALQQVAFLFDHPYCNSYMRNLPRYKIVLLLGFFLLVVWASTGKKEAEEEIESPPLPSKQQMPEKAAGDSGREFLDFDYKYDRRKSEKGREDVRNVKEEVARVVAQARVEHNQIKENLIFDGSNREKPKQDLRSQGGGKMLATRRRTDTLNGVQLPADPAGRTILC